MGRSPGELYDQKKFDTPYIRDFLLDRGALADVSETSAPWSALPNVYDAVMRAEIGLDDLPVAPGDGREAEGAGLIALLGHHHVVMSGTGREGKGRRCGQDRRPHDSSPRASFPRPNYYASATPR